MKKPKSKNPIARRMVEIARSEIGVREKPRDSNRGPRVEEYQRATWLDGTGWPWCAAFVCWVVMMTLQQLLAQKKISEPAWERPRTAGAWDFERWARAKSQRENGVLVFSGRALRDLVIEPGDIIVYTFSHIGLCESGGEAEVHTIEGNTNPSGSREGGGVYAMTRKRSLVRSVIRIPAS